MFAQEIFEVNGADQVDHLSRRTAIIAGRNNFDRVQAEEISIIVTELATNIVKFAQSGKILVCPFTLNGLNGIDIFGVDHGPGIKDVERALRDEYSTSGSMGTGLGAVKRLSDEFGLFSLRRETDNRQEHGFTAVFARKWIRDKTMTHPGASFRFGFCTRPLPGEEQNGDNFLFLLQGAQSTIAVIDGLGHGREASLASQSAVDYLSQNPPGSIEDWIAELHGCLSHTRGAAIGIARLDKARKKLVYGGIGNINARIVCSPKPIHPVSVNGILGHRFHKVKACEFEWIPGSILILSTDGVSSKWEIENFPGLKDCHPALISEVIFENFARKNDDATIVVIQ